VVRALVCLKVAGGSERVLAGVKAAHEQVRLSGRPRALSEDDLAVARALLTVVRCLGNLGPDNHFGRGARL